MCNLIQSCEGWYYKHFEIFFFFCEISRKSLGAGYSFQRGRRVFLHIIHYAFTYTIHPYKLNTHTSQLTHSYYLHRHTHILSVYNKHTNYIRLLSRSRWSGLHMITCFAFFFSHIIHIGTRKSSLLQYYLLYKCRPWIPVRRPIIFPKYITRDVQSHNIVHDDNG